MSHLESMDGSNHPDFEGSGYPDGANKSGRPGPGEVLLDPINAESFPGVSAAVSRRKFLVYALAAAAAACAPARVSPTEVTADSPENTRLPATEPATQPSTDAVKTQEPQSEATPPPEPQPNDVFAMPTWEQLYKDVEVGGVPESAGVKEYEDAIRLRFGDKVSTKNVSNNLPAPNFRWVPEIRDENGRLLVNIKSDYPLRFEHVPLAEGGSVLRVVDDDADLVFLEGTEAAEYRFTGQSSVFPIVMGGDVALPGEESREVFTHVWVRGEMQVAPVLREGLFNDQNQLHVFNEPANQLLKLVGPDGNPIKKSEGLRVVYSDGHYTIDQPDGLLKLQVFDESGASVRLHNDRWLRDGVWHEWKDETWVIVPGLALTEGVGYVLDERLASTPVFPEEYVLKEAEPLVMAWSTKFDKPVMLAEGLEGKTDKIVGMLVEGKWVRGTGWDSIFTFYGEGQQRPTFGVDGEEPTDGHIKFLEGFRAALAYSQPMEVQVPKAKFKDLYFTLGEGSAYFQGHNPVNYEGNLIDYGRPIIVHTFPVRADGTFFKKVVFDRSGAPIIEVYPRSSFISEPISALITHELGSGAHASYHHTFYEGSGLTGDNFISK